MDGGYDEFREDSLVASYVSKIAELSFKFECDRGENLRIYADKLPLSISMLSVAFVTPLEYIINTCGEFGGQAGRRLGSFTYLICLGLLSIALVITLVAMFLRKGEALDSPDVQYNYFINTYKKQQSCGKHVNELNLLKAYCSSLSVPSNGLRNKHNRMWVLLKISTALSIASLGVAIFGAIFLFIVVI